MLLIRPYAIHTMLIGYARLSKADGSQVADLQHDALVRAGVSAKRIYELYFANSDDCRTVLFLR